MKRALVALVGLFMIVGLSACGHEMTNTEYFDQMCDGAIGPIEHTYAPRSYDGTLVRCEHDGHRVAVGWIDSEDDWADFIAYEVLHNTDDLVDFGESHGVVLAID